MNVNFFRAFHFQSGVRREAHRPSLLNCSVQCKTKSSSNHLQLPTINIIIMLLLEAIFLLITFVFMPFVTHGESWTIKLFYIGLCGFLAPIIGIPSYRHLIK